jgi:hypothetical protein
MVLLPKSLTSILFTKNHPLNPLNPIAPFAGPRTLDAVPHAINYPSAAPSPADSQAVAPQDLDLGLDVIMQDADPGVHAP